MFPGWIVFLGGEEYEMPPEGWVTCYRLSKIVKYVGEVTIARWANEYRVSNSKWFGIFHAGNSPAEFYHPELANIIKEKATTYTKAPVGWKTAEKLYKIFHTSPNIIKSLADVYRKDNTGWFKKYWEGGQFTEFYHPDLIKKIKNDIDLMKVAVSNGWKRVTSFAGELKVEKSTVRSVAANYLLKHPEWSKKFWVHNGLAEHYNPDLVKIIKSHLPFKNPESGWKNLHEVDTETDGISRAYFRKLFLPFKKSNPEWFKFCKSKNGSKREYMHPRLIEEVIKKIKEKRSLS